MRYLRREQSLIILVFLILMVSSLFALAVYEPFKVKLNLYERIVVMSLLPEKANFITWKVIKDLQMELAPTEEELNKVGYHILDNGSGATADNWLAVPEKEIIFGDIAKGLIVGALEKLDKEEKLTNDHFTVYQKFMIEKNEIKEGD